LVRDRKRNGVLHEGARDRMVRLYWRRNGPSGLPLKTLNRTLNSHRKRARGRSMFRRHLV